MESERDAFYLFLMKTLPPAGKSMDLIGVFYRGKKKKKNPQLRWVGCFRSITPTAVLTPAGFVRD